MKTVLILMLTAMLCVGCVKTVYRVDDGSLKAVRMSMNGVDGVWIPNARLRQVRYSCEEIQLTLKQINEEKQ